MGREIVYENKKVMWDIISDINPCLFFLEKIKVLLNVNRSNQCLSITILKDFL